MVDITKIGLAVMHSNRVLLVRKQSTGFYILPGGKPESGEDDLTALAREIDEELGCRLDIDSVQYLSEFSDNAAGHEGVRVHVRLYIGCLIGAPTPRAEIDDLKWVSPSQNQTMKLAPSLRNSILPYLAKINGVERRDRCVAVGR